MGTYPQIKMKKSPQLSFDIQVEIIKRLPVKSLLHFRSVCKPWKSLIDSSQFIAGYIPAHDQPQKRLMISYKEENEVKYVCFVDDDTFPENKFVLTDPGLPRSILTVIGSSHGLSCLHAYLREPDGSSPTFENDIFVIWNPAIRKSIAIAAPDELQTSVGYVLGFGVCPDTKDPKIVRITCIDDYLNMGINCHRCQVMVFTLSSGEWRCLCSNQLPRKSIDFSGFQTVTDQFIYWVAYDQTAMDGVFDNLIMSFDLSTEKFREIEIPDSLHQSDLAISRLRESLVLLDYKVNSDKKVCDVWMMEHGDPKAFTKLFTINASNASIERTLGFGNNGEPILAMHHDDDEDEDEDLYSQSKLVVYEPCLEHIHDLGIRGPRYSLFAGSYTESLLLLDHNDDHIVECGAAKM